MGPFTVLTVNVCVSGNYPSDALRFSPLQIGKVIPVWIIIYFCLHLTIATTVNRLTLFLNYRSNIDTLQMTSFSFKKNLIRVLFLFEISYVDQNKLGLCDFLYKILRNNFWTVVYKYIKSSQSPDLNPIEQIWDLVDSKIDRTTVLSKSLGTTRNYLDVNNNRDCGKVLYIKTMPVRMQDVFKAKGRHSKYYVF